MTGWQCPKCGACYNPSVQQCFNCTGVTITVWPVPSGSGGTNTNGTCPSCGRHVSEPPSTGCPAGYHYGTYVSSC